MWCGKRFLQTCSKFDCTIPQASETLTDQKGPIASSANLETLGINNHDNDDGAHDDDDDDVPVVVDDVSLKFLKQQWP